MSSPRWALKTRVHMQVAETIAQLGTCSRLQVGFVAIRDGRILVTGYNGAPAGMKHCDHGCNCTHLHTHQSLAPPYDKHMGDCPANPAAGCSIAVHAEANGIAFAAKHGVSLKDADLYCTDTPCLSCAMLMVNTGATRVYYRREYRVQDGLNLLRKAGLRVVRLA